MVEKRKKLTPAGDQAFRANTPYGRNYEHCFSGTVSFLRRMLTRNLDNVDVAVTGIPLDLATTARSGARLGPRGVREASLELATTTPFPFGFDPFTTLSVVDYGDCHISFDVPHIIPQEIERHIDTIIKGGAMPLSIGGDHFVTYPILKALYNKYGTINLIHFDAHPDTWEDTPPDGYDINNNHVFMNHGSMFRRAALEGIIDPNHSIQLGIRTYVPDDMGFLQLSPDDMHQHGLDTVITMIKERVTDGPTYLTFDIDCLDPAYAPGTGTPVCGGLTTREALYIIRQLTAINFIGMDVVEVAPAYDNSDITALAAANIAHDFLCVLSNELKAISKIR